MTVNEFIQRKPKLKYSNSISTIHCIIACETQHKQRKQHKTTYISYNDVPKDIAEKEIATILMENKKRLTLQIQIMPSEIDTQNYLSVEEYFNIMDTSIYNQYIVVDLRNDVLMNSNNLNEILNKYATDKIRTITTIENVIPQITIKTN